jgi:hypothetical protein
MISRPNLAHDQCVGVAGRGGLPRTIETTTGLRPHRRRGKPAAGSTGASEAEEAVPAAGMPPSQEPQVLLRSAQAPGATATDSSKTLATKPL